VALENLGEAAKPYVEDIANIFKDKTVDSSVRRSAAEALGNLGEAAKPYVQDITDILKDETVDFWVRKSAAVALGNLGETAKLYLQDIADILKDKTVDSDIRSSAAVALGKIEQLNLNNVLLILDSIYYPGYYSSYYPGQSEFEQWRFLTYFLGGGTDEVKIPLTWLGFPNTKTIPSQLSHEQGDKTLKIFVQAWEASRDFARLREDLAKQIVVVSKKVSWRSQDIPILETHYNNLKKSGYNEADSLQSVIVNLKG
jgi:HEAT repeat protein